MYKNFKFLWLIVLFFTFDTTNANASSYITKASMINWITNESGHKVDIKTATTIVSHIVKQSKLQKIDPFLILSLIKNESGFKTNAISNYGAMGLMQVVPRWHGDKIAGRAITGVAVNIEVGSKILDDCLNQSNGFIRKALYCYSGGAKKYTDKLQATYSDIKKHDTKYRFKNDLPITLSGSFLKPRNFKTDDDLVLAQN